MELFLPRLVSIGLKCETEIHVKFGQGVDPYFDIPMPKSMKGW
jgi:hypothetical protein